MSKNRSGDLGVLALCLLGGGAIAAGVYLATRPAQPMMSPEDARLLDIARSLLKRVARVMRVEAPPIRLSLSVQNAESNGRDIVINPRWLSGELQKHCDDMQCGLNVLLGILAHELAHHVHGDAGRPPEHRFAIELGADRWAAVALARLGIPSHDFERVIWAISSHYGGSPDGYPSRATRVNAIRETFTQAWCALAYARGRSAAYQRYGLVG